METLVGVGKKEVAKTMPTPPKKLCPPPGSTSGRGGQNRGVSTPKKNHAHPPAVTQKSEVSTPKKVKVSTPKKGGGQKSQKGWIEYSKKSENSYSPRAPKMGERRRQMEEKIYGAGA